MKSEIWGYADHMAVDRHRLIPQVEEQVPYPITFMGITGSHMWSLATPESDLDVRGIYVKPTEQILSIHPGRDTIETPHSDIDAQTRDIKRDVDVQFYEIEKACGMLLAHNGNLVELALSPSVFYSTGAGIEFREIARNFLTKRLRDYYRGYATSQRKRAAQNRGGKALVYCVTPGHRVLTADLRWVPVESVQVGDELLGFDDHISPGKSRRWHRSLVLANPLQTAQVYEVLLSDDTRLIATAEHPWLTYHENATQRYRWTRTDHILTRRGIRVGMRFRRLLPVWEADKSFESGYLSGFFDGEGSVVNPPSEPLGGKSLMVNATQNPGATYDRAVARLESTGLSPLHTRDSRGIRRVYIGRGKAEVLRFLGSVRPERLLADFVVDNLGAVRVSDKSNLLRVVSVRLLGIQEVIGLTTSTATYLVEGFGSHNTYREIFAGIWLMRTGLIEYDFRTLWANVERESIYRSNLLPRVFDRPKWQVVSPDEMLEFEREWNELCVLLDATAEFSPLPDDYDGYAQLNDLLLRVRRGLLA